MNTNQTEMQNPCWTSHSSRYCTETWE
jgi:hypothetical protein